MEPASSLPQGTTSDAKLRKILLWIGIIVAIDSVCSSLCWFVFGWTGNPIFTLYIFPSALLKIVSLLAFMIVGLIFVIRKRTLSNWLYLLKTGCFFALIPLTFYYANAPLMITSGCYARFMTKYRKADLRALAHFAATHSSSKNDSRLIDVDKAIFSRFPFLGEYGPAPCFFKNQNVIEISWGGALIGHHGFAITLDQKPLDTSLLLASPTDSELHADKDIVFFDGN